MNWAKKRVLVTGGAGFIGSHLVETLLDLGATLTVVDKLKIPSQDKLWRDKLAYYQQLWLSRGFKLESSHSRVYTLSSGDNIALKTIDVETNRKALEELLVKRDIDVVFHLAAVFGGRGFVDSRQADCCECFGINHNVIAASHEAGVKHVHFSSSACVYAPSLNRPGYLLKEDDILSTSEGWASSDNSYGFAKLMAELELKCYYEQYGLESSVARYLTVYGPGEFDESHALAALIRRVLRRENPFIVWGSGMQERGFTYVSDIVAGSIRSAETVRDATPVNLGWDKRYRIKDVVDMILELADFKPEVIYDRSKPEGPFSRALDITRAKTLLGWNPKVDLPEGLHRTYEWAETYLKNVPTYT